MIIVKKLVIPTTKDLKKLESYCDGFILGITDLCINCSLTFTMDEVKEIIQHYPNKEFFISVNKNMHQQDLPHLKEVLLQAEQLPVKGIFYYDISVVEYKQELSLTKDLVWNQEHLATNYSTCNYWYQFGAKYSCLSSEITLEEIKTIHKNAKGILMVPVFGYIPMFTSKRHVVKNYLKYFNLSSSSPIHYIKKEGFTYPIMDVQDGTTVYSSSILNAIEELDILKQIGIEYVILNAFLIPEDIFVEVLKIYEELTEENKKQLYHRIQQLLPNCDKGFLYKETIYKVK